jgi:regulator of protease activity HflC (stomatin/prohibitin superfamily)
MYRALVAALLGGLALGACTNPEVPAGHEGYIHHIPLIFGKMKYEKSLAGPASTGISWRAYTINIDMRERNYPERFELLTQDDLHLSFEVNTRIRLRPGTVKDIVETWGSSKWYEWNVKEPLRTIVRREVMRVKAANIQLQTSNAGKSIKKALEEKYKDTPFEIQSVDIGSFEFPDEVDKAIQEKIAKQQELKRQGFILERTRKEAAITVFEALKVNKRQRIIAETLDPLYVQWAAVQVYRKLAESPNNTVIMLPNTSEGTGVPQILSGGKRKQLGADDDAELQRIEKHYRDFAQKSAEEERNRKALQSAEN